jgi:hypothetical protein
VKSKSHRQLLAEIQTAKLAYHTYSLPDAIQPHLVLKGTPPNVPVDEIQAELTAKELQVVKISQFKKTDKTTQTMITKYPVSVVTFQPGTDIHDVLQIKKLCHCIIRWKRYKNTKPVHQCFNSQSHSRSSNYYSKPHKCVKCDQPHAMWECKKPTGMPLNCVNCGGAHPGNFTSCPSYQQLNFLHQQQPRLPKPTTPVFQFKQAHFPTLKPPSPPQSHKTRAQTVFQPTTPMNP